MNREEFDKATDDWSGVKAAPVLTSRGIDYSHAQVSCYELPDLKAWHDTRRQIFKAAAGYTVGINRYDEANGRVAAIVVAPNEDIQRKITQAVGTPKFSKPLYQPA